MIYEVQSRARISGPSACASGTAIGRPKQRALFQLAIGNLTARDVTKCIGELITDILSTF